MGFTNGHKPLTQMYKNTGITGGKIIDLQELEEMFSKRLGHDHRG